MPHNLNKNILRPGNDVPRMRGRQPGATTKSPRIPHLGSFRIKLAAYFVLLSLLPVGAAFWGFSSLAGHDETRRSDTRLESELRSTLANYRDELAPVQATATQLARRSDIQRLLERRNRSALAQFLADRPNVDVVMPGGVRIGKRPPALSVRRSARVIARGDLVGTIVAYRPVDEQLARRLRTGLGLGSGEVIAIARFSRIVASSPPIDGRIAGTPGVPGSITIGGVGYRALLAGPVRDFAGEQIAVLSPQSLIDTANSSTRLRLLALLLAMVLVIAIASYFEGRAIVRTLQGLVVAVNGIAHGTLHQRVPVKGRDELAQLGHAFNEMADQLETQLRELEEERARLGSATERIGATLAATHDPDQLLGVVLETTREAAGATSAVLANESGELLQIGQPDPADERLALPLVAGETSYGTLTLSGRQFSDEQRRAAKSLAAQAVIALENARLHSIVERQAHTDGLTGLASRRHFEERLALELARATRFDTPLALVVADLDNFKAVNDRHGHAVGDLVLREFAAVVRKTIREVDLAGRWGGEEFALLLPGTDARGGMQLAERLRAAIESQAVILPDGSALKITASLGVSSHSAPSSVEDLFEAADEALYRAKTSGKNQVK
jgi:diguanylate cyclase (GGDEF)-like protein